MTQGLVLYDASAHVVALQSALHRHVRTIDRHRETGVPFLRPDPASQGYRDPSTGDVEEFCSNILKQRRARQGHPQHPEGRGRAFVSDRQQAAGAGRMGRDDRRHHRAPTTSNRNATAIMRSCVRSSTTYRRRSRSRTCATAATCWPTGWPRFSSDCRATPSSARRPSICFRSRSPSISPRTTTGRCNSPTACCWTSTAGKARLSGDRFITSKRIGIPDQTGEPRYIINVVDDVTERRRADEKIAHLAHYDALTDLPNRVLFRERIERELQRTSRGEQFALLYIDVDEFKGINDSLGHHVGDELLKAVAGRIRSCIRETDHVARLGGDEFAVIQTDVADTARCRGIRDANSRGDPAALSMPRPSPFDRCQHRHCAGAAGRHRSRSADQECRSGDVRRQGRRPSDPPLLRSIVRNNGSKKAVEDLETDRCGGSCNTAEWYWTCINFI